tara:strand:- start:3757 stop:4014 length:258 start_codon:yes stop_codon:yes gene_type:complete
MISSSVTAINAFLHDKQSNPILDLSKCVASLAYLNAIEKLLPNPQLLLQKTGLDVNEARLIFAKRLTNISKVLNVDIDRLQASSK